MASYSQPSHLQAYLQLHQYHRGFHNWKVPAHYMLCEPCRIFRREEIRLSNAKALDEARRNALAVGQPCRPRAIKIGSRFRDSYFRTPVADDGLVDVTIPKQVTIQVPSRDGVDELGKLERSDQPLHRQLLRKRSFSSIDDPEPVQYFVPQYFDPVSL
jgi:hypothetical protein